LGFAKYYSKDVSSVVFNDTGILVCFGILNKVIKIGPMQYLANQLQITKININIKRGNKNYVVGTSKSIESIDI
jgi:hypothetical protein